MKNIKEIVEQNPEFKSAGSGWLKIKGNPPQTLKLLRGEITKNRDYQTGEMNEGVMLYFDKDGEELKYFVKKWKDSNEDQFNYLFETFADIEEGDFVRLSFEKKKGSKFEGFIVAKKVDADEQVPDDAYNDEIPVINE